MPSGVSRAVISRSTRRSGSRPSVTPSQITRGVPLFGNVPPPHKVSLKGATANGSSRACRTIEALSSSTSPMNRIVKCMRSAGIQVTFARPAAAVARRSNSSLKLAARLANVWPISTATNSLTCVYSHASNRRDLMLRFVFAVTLLLPIAPAFGQTAAPPIPPASHRLVYLEVAPSEANRVAAALKDYRRAAMNAVGALRIDVLQQVGRTNHFAIYETWRDNAALEGHKSAAETRTLDGVLQTTRVSPLDER